MLGAKTVSYTHGTTQKEETPTICKYLDYAEEALIIVQVKQIGGPLRTLGMCAVIMKGFAGIVIQYSMREILRHAPTGGHEDYYWLRVPRTLSPARQPMMVRPLINAFWRRSF